MERRKVLRLFLVSSVAAVIAPKLAFGQTPFYQNLDFSSLDFGSDFKWGVAVERFEVAAVVDVDTEHLGAYEVAHLPSALPGCVGA